MNILEIDLNCMCLFVPDPQADSGIGTVYVLMPATGHCSGGERHVVRMLYRPREGAEQMREMEGWELVLGALPGTARTSLEPSGGGTEGTLVDLTKLTAEGEGRGRCRVPDRLLHGINPKVAARIVLHAGSVTDLDAQPADWELNGERRLMPHRLTWRLQVPAMELTWTPMVEEPGQSPPLESLADVYPSPEGDDTVYRLHVHHVTAAAFDASRQPGGGDPETPARFEPRVLDETEIREHFRMFYAFLGLTDPDERLLPHLAEDRRDDPEGGGGGWACKLAQAMRG